MNVRQFMELYLASTYLNRILVMGMHYAVA